MEFHVLGPLEVTEGEDQLALGGLRQRRLLAQLVLRANEVVSLDRLVESVWDGEEVPEKADRVVRSYVSRLRRSLQPDASADELTGIVSHRAPGYLLEVDPDQVDASRAERLAAEAEARLGFDEPEAALDLYEQAIGLWRGRSYEEFCDSDWAAPESQRLEQLRAQIEESRVECRLHMGQHRDVVGDLEILVERYPLRERLWGQLMLAEYRSGRQADALRTYQRLRSTLAEEVGIDPSPELKELERRILDQSTELELAEPRSGQPALTGTLPTPRTMLVGRDEAITQLVDAVRSSRLVTLIGVGGVGKTRLALETAHRVASDHPGGTWWAELAPVGELEDVLSVVTTSLELRAKPGADQLETICEGVGGQQILLVLDNCEHVIDDVHELVEQMLSRCPEARVLATSREPLASEGEVIVPLSPLATHDESAERSPAVEMFLERARSAGVDLGSDRGKVAEICRRIDGLPLAIELAAALTRTLSIQEIHEGLDQRFELLVGARRSSDRHRTLRNTLAWSYDLLDEDARELLQWLAVFAGSFSLDDLRQVTGYPGAAAVQGLRGLVDKSLVVVTPSGGRTRYRLLETVREFSAEQLEASGRSAARRSRHAAAYAALAIELGGASRGPDEAEAVHRVAGSLDNFREAFRWAELTADHAVALTLATELLDIAVFRGIPEILGWAPRALAIPGADQTARGASAVAVVGEAALQRGDLPGAEEAAQRAMRMDPAAHRAALPYLVHVGAALFAHDGEALAARSTRMREIAEAAGDEHDTLLARVNRALASGRLPPHERLDELDRLDADTEAFGNGLLRALFLFHRGLTRREEDPAGGGRDIAESAALAGRCGYELTERRARRERAFVEGLEVEEPTSQLRNLAEMAAACRGPGMALDRQIFLRMMVPLLARLGWWEELVRVASFVRRGSAHHSRGPGQTRQLPFRDLGLGEAMAVVGVRDETGMLDAYVAEAERHLDESTAEAAVSSGREMDGADLVARVGSLVEREAPG